ncbi:MAG: hypothetical protein JOZ52_08385 [Acidobacteria bacterium]|nr:hypothetical protein [Acidobacteriota bacterium]
MPLLSSADWPRVRRSLNAALDTTSLPNESLADFQAEAEEETLDTIGKAEADLTTEELSHARNAARYLLAALVAPTVTFTIQGDSSGGFIRVPLDLTEQAKTLRMLFAEEVAEITIPGGEVEARIPRFFGLAHGFRGR